MESSSLIRSEQLGSHQLFLPGKYFVAVLPIFIKRQFNNQKISSHTIYFGKKKLYANFEMRVCLLWRYSIHLYP